MTIKATLLAVGATALVALSGAASATALVVTSYSMPNGDGQAHSGSFNYWDKSYSGSGSTTTDGAALSGGTGDLTDGVVASDFWYMVENNAGTGPFVGWRGDFGVKNPLITFNFGSAVTVNNVSIHLDNSHVGGVGIPTAIWIDGIAQSYSPPSGGLGFVTFGGLSLTGASHTIQFFQDPTFVWTFVSEVTFDGSTRSAVPEPATWAMLIAGLGAVGAAMRRRRTAISFA